MKSKYIASFLLSFLIVLGNLPMQAAPVVATSKTPALAVSRLEKLRKLGVTVLYPAFLPSRFSLASVDISDTTDGGKDHPDYKLNFRDKNGLIFSIESAYTGIGDGPDGDRTLKGKSPTIGSFTIYVFKPGSEGNATKQVYYLSNWFTEQKSPRPYHHFLGHGVTDKEALLIVQSLRPYRN